MSETIKYRYLLFATEHYYPGGGMSDCIFKTNNLNELKQFAKKYFQERPSDTDDLHYYDVALDEVYIAQCIKESIDICHYKTDILSWNKGSFEWQRT